MGCFVKELDKCDDTRECKILMGALKWRYLSRDHESLYKLNIFETLHRGSDKLRRLWGKPVQLELPYKGHSKREGSEMTNQMLQLFDMLFM